MRCVRDISILLRIDWIKYPNKKEPSLSSSWLEFSKLLQFFLQFYHVRSQLIFTQQKWEGFVVGKKIFSEKLTFVHFEYPGLCDFKLACHNMKERLRSKSPWNTMASSFFSMFLYIGPKSTWLVCVLASLERNKSKASSASGEQLNLTFKLKLVYMTSVT